jgi:hypothetical protein
MKCKNSTSFSFLYLLFTGSMLALFATGCTPDKGGPIGQKPTASFKMTAVTGRVNTYALESTSTGAFSYQWKKGNSDFAKGNAMDTVYFPTKGTYSVQLRAFGRGGYDTAAQSVTITVDDIKNNPEFKLLVSTGWKLDGSDGANTIIVGTEGNPSEYFPGGPLADCQKDDVYTFSDAFKLTYNANGNTFNAGNINPTYTCSTDRSYSDLTYTFEPGVSAGGAGIASITIPGAVPDHFIGVTDVSSNHYRIISISATSLVLRSGTPSETVHQFKFIPAQ